jgi:hypothetical protein
MKRSIYAFCAVAALTFTLTSCEKTKPLDEAIVGRWEVISEHQIYSIGSDKKFEYILYYDDKASEYEFTSGGSIIRYYLEVVEGMSAYTISGTTIIIENGDTDISWDNVSADETTLTWSQTVTEVIENLTYTVEIIYTAVKSK